MKIDLKKIKKVYFVGIKGSGVVAVAEIFQKRGAKVSGSDTHEKFFTDEVLRKLGISFAEGFAVENIPAKVDLAVYSTAYSETSNVEMAELRRRGVTMLSYPEVLGLLFNERFGIAVCGTHGKTTTTALLGMALETAGVDPTVVVGGRVKQWKSNARVGSGEYFAIEADEYQNKLNHYAPKAVLLTSVDFDHPDFFPNFQSYKKVFKDFVGKLPFHGSLVAWGDSVDTLEVVQQAKCNAATYGFGEENDFWVRSYELKMLKDGSSRQVFSVEHKGRDLGEFEIQLIGKHNVLNAVAVIALCYRMNLDLERVKEGLAKFQGTSRRFELIGKRNGALLIDDYGHHPDELVATFRAARELYPDKNIIAVFHPHTFTRTHALLQGFAQSFSDVDEAIILDIYGSARETQGGVSSAELVQEINRYQSGRAMYLPGVPEAVDYLRDKIGKDDVVIAIGAGDVWRVVEQLKK